jgi:hypothetical protein
LKAAAAFISLGLDAGAKAAAKHAGGIGAGRSKIKA